MEQWVFGPEQGADAARTERSALRQEVGFLSILPRARVDCLVDFQGFHVRKS